MQIGNPELDSMCEQVIVPALKACGLDPKRVDKHNKGDLLKSEIIAFIKNAEIIVADLTNERPNCYLEVGYVMGVDKNQNLILTAREDHDQNSPNHRSDGPKVHFDLSGYDILFWDPHFLEDFKGELEKRIKRRQAIPTLKKGESQQSPWDDKWLERHRAESVQGLLPLFKVPNPGYMQIGFAVSGSKPSLLQTDLLEAARSAEIHTSPSGWAIAQVLDGPNSPKPSADEIVSNVSQPYFKSYQYWALRRNGDFYLLDSFLEDVGTQTQGLLCFDTQIERIAEALLYCERLYSYLNLKDATVNIWLRHVGLKDRVIGRFHSATTNRKTTENEVQSYKSISLANIKPDLVEVIKDLTNPLFAVFDYFKLPDHTYSQIVENFMGKVSPPRRYRS